MKALRYASLAVVGFALYDVPPPAHAVIQSFQECYEFWTVSDAGNSLSRSCITISFDDGNYGGSGRDGMPGEPPTVPNRGDAPAPQRDASEGDCSKQAANPVVFTTGNKIEPESDFASAGEMPLSLTRTYNYYWNGIGIFGRRWLSDYDYKLLFTTDDPTSSCYPRPGNDRCDPLNKPIWAQRPDGRKIKFNYSTTPVPGWYEDKPTPVAKIIQTGSTYTLYSEDRTVEIYDYYGFPSTIKNQQNIGWTFTYDGSHYLQRVTHSSGRHVDFGWTGGTLSQVTDPAGNVYHYSYKTIGLTNSLMAANAVSTSTLSPSLMMMPEPDDPPPTPYNPPTPSMVALLTTAVQPATAGSSPGTTVTYQYEDSRFPTALTGKTVNNQRYAWFTYDANGRVIESKHADGADRYQFAYALNSNNVVTRTTITNPLGKQTFYDIDAKGNITGVTGLASTHCPATYKATQYDSHGYPSGTIGFDGSSTLYTYGANGQLQQQVAGAGTPDAQTTDYTWDSTYNRVTKVVLEGDHETTYHYDPNNRLTSTSIKNLSTKVVASSGQSRSVTYTYTTWPSGLIATMVIDGPVAGSGDAVTLSYSQAGDLLSSKDALGNTTSYGNYNNLGFPGYIVGPNGERHAFTYDARGRVVVNETNRNGSTQHTTYEYDGFGRLSRVTQADGQTHSYQYDVAGRLISEFEPEAGGTFAQTVYSYNAMSLPVSVKKQRVYAEPQRGTVP